MQDATEPRAFKRVRVVDVQRESSVIKSFALEAVDDALLPAFLPGQFVQVRITGAMGRVCCGITACPVILPSAHAGAFRSSINYRGALPDGLVSSHLHGVVEAGATLDVAGPAGAFVLDEHSDRPVG